MKSTNPEGGLWKEGFGAIGATLRELEKRGVRQEHLARLRSDGNYADLVAKAMKECGVDFFTGLAGWQKFYEDLKIPANFVNLRIPAKQKGLDRLLVNPQWLTIQGAYDKCAELFPCWKYVSGSLDKAIPTNDRDTKNGAYAFWVRNRVEADKELKNLSANDLARKQIKGITVLERLIYELKYFKETGKHLDVENVTLCAGSRYTDGGVPCVDWRGVRLSVGWYYPDDCGGCLRARAAV